MEKIQRLRQRLFLVCELEGPYEIALRSLETYYSFPNVDKKNNKIRVSLDNGTSWNDLTFAVGCYEHKDINAELQRQLVVLGGKKEDIILKPLSFLYDFTGLFVFFVT